MTLYCPQKCLISTFRYQDNNICLTDSVGNQQACMALESHFSFSPLLSSCIAPSIINTN